MPGTVFILAISGGSGAGKTTAAALVAAALAPVRVAILCEDDYYRDHAATPGFDPETYNFDDVAARDHDLLAEHLRQLGAGNAIEVDRYDFVTHTRLGLRARLPPARVVIVEGAHVLHPASLRALYDHAIYLDAPDDVRLARRLARDMAERGRSREAILRQYHATVLPMHARYTLPGRRLADDVIALDAGSSALADGLDRIIRLIRARLAEQRDE